MNVRLSAVALLLGSALASAQLSPLPLSAQPGIDVNALDRTADPCQNFYQYACGGWMASHPLPGDRSRYGTFEELAERNEANLRKILQDSAANPGRSALDQKLGDFYASCIDEAGAEKRGLQPVQPLLTQIRNLKSKDGLAALVAHLHLDTIPVFFSFGAEQDAKDSTKVIAVIDQGGLGLPDRDDYLATDEKAETIRKAYVAHVARLFELAGDTAAAAAAKAQAVMRIETALAKGSLDRVARRDPNMVYHPMSAADVLKLAPSFKAADYVRTVKPPSLAKVNVTHPEFLQTMDKVIQAESLADLQTYLSWHVLHNASPWLTQALFAENFNFYGKTLAGQKQPRSREKRCAQAVDDSLGEALGRKYAEQYFPAESKQRMLGLVHDVEGALQQDIRQLDWMSEATKKRALEKLAAITNKIGYPEKWRDYSSVEIKRNDLWGNLQRASAFEFRRQLNKIGKPVDKQEWFMTPPTVNAYYDPQNNNINFPAGILQPPFYDAKADNAANLGGIGAVIGHELTHGFDDQGRQFDFRGNLENWWTPEDSKEFTKRADCVVEQYGQYSPVEGVRLNGKLTLGENVADNGGARVAYLALLEGLAKKTINPEKLAGFTPEQRFFLGWAQVWCQNITPEAARLRARTDPHSAGQFRVNGTVSNMPEFGQAFGCRVGQPMVRENACRIW